ncbi:MAG: hypothetical protein HFG98_05550 [Dorea sp.]|nr:hypothetical protein [Dorea sp.]
MERINVKKEIVCWGIGRICRNCLVNYPEVNPSFFIDSYAACKIFEGKTVKSPKEIDDWTKYYIIITIKSKKAKAEIEEFLIEKGLHKEQDFCTYDHFFTCQSITVEKSMHLVEKYINEHPEMMSPILLRIPVTGIRNDKAYSRFISKYIKKRGSAKCVILSVVQGEISEEFPTKFGCSVLRMPNSFMNQEDISGNNEEIESLLAPEEMKWLEETRRRKLSDDKEEELHVSIKLYYYYKIILKQLKPSKIIFWSNWNIESYIVGHLADAYNIPCGFMEYGWLPGTYQVDPRGIAGQSEYAVNPRMFETLEVTNIYDVKKIKQYIIDCKMDTRTFADTEEDNAALLRLDQNKKNIFLVGMDDHGMRMNPQNEYWKKYVSNVVESTEETLILLAELCKRNNWNLIFKPHPGNRAYHYETDFENIILVRDMKIDKLIKLADVVVSIASSVDYKTLIYGKPLVQLGIHTLLGKGCTYVVLEKGMLEKQICLALENGMTEEQIEKFDRLLQILLQKYLWDDLSDRSLRYGRSTDEDFLS